MYESGLLVAFLLWLFSMVMLLVSVNSQFERNLNKIGQRLSWVTLTPIEIQPADLRRSMAVKVLRFFFIAAFGLFFVVFSWLYVVVWIGGFAYRKSKDAGAPQVIREFRWKLRNVDMTFDEVARGLMKATDQEGIEFDDFREALISDLKGRGIYQR